MATSCSGQVQLAAGEVDTVCSDHAPWTLAAKLDPALDVVTARQGVADLETLMPMLFSEGVAAGRISLDRFVELTSASTARLFGLYPRKGTIAVGSDADLGLWDPQQRRIIDGSRMQSRAGYVGVRRLERAGLAPVRPAPRPARAGRRHRSGPARYYSPGL
jgi:dihydroorotase-like cyclic amidohydrolase